MKNNKRKPKDGYGTAIALVKKIADDEYRRAAIEAVIVTRVRRELGHSDLSCELAMRLRREAMAS
jgi:hypothetical protein